jgi:catechol 2,3-dioxygenase-like lactoylglutathione lyase family enzyme
MTTAMRETTAEPPRVAILFDVADLDRTCAYYESALGFRVVATERAGLPFQTRTLRSERYPALALKVRHSYRRPVVGSAPGGVVHIALREPDLARIARSLDGKVMWTVPPGPEGAPCTGVEFMDPDGYLIRLFA